jgi:ABC-2 type transport system ATP-binding protein
VSALLETSGLVKQFGEFRAVDHVDFRVREGEVLALIGSNGAGKTTLVNLISGLLRPDEGRILFRGADVTQQSVHERIAAGIARSFQLVNLFDQLSALDNVALAIFSRQRKTRKLFTLAEADRPVWQEAIEILATFRMEPKARVLAGGLSQGERKLLDVAVAYALRPKLLFLDEPTTGFDPEARRRFWGLIDSLKADGTTILLTTHYLEEAAQLADRAAVINGGRIIDIGRIDEIGGADARVPVVRWRQAGIQHERRTTLPGQVVAGLYAEAGGEPDGLEVIRPSLEDIYLSLVGADTDQKVAAELEAKPA